MKIKLSVISFTENGRKRSEQIRNIVKERHDYIKDEIEVFSYTKHAAGAETQNQPDIFVESSLGEWAGAQMSEKHALLFIGACGIAVRAIAPHLTDKLHDSPVLVMDEQGNYVIPILSGHMGGANELAFTISDITGAKPVITTSTDLNERFAIDLFAKKHVLSIVNKEGIAKVSAKSLAGERITISVETGHLAETGGRVFGCCITEHGKWENYGLETIHIVPYPPQMPVDIVITSEEKKYNALIMLKPKEYVIGIGCKKGIGEAQINEFITHKLKSLGISTEQIFALSSISQKQKEQGIVEWSRKHRIPFYTYTAEELRGVRGKFGHSSFVEKQVGVDNVCERAALKACGPGGILISEKEAASGMTIAVAKRKWSVNLDEK